MARIFPASARYNSVMARGERVIAISRFIAGLIVAQHHVDPARIRVIPRGVDPAVFDPDAVTPERVRRLAESWHLPPGRQVAMLPGRLARWKGQSVFVRALAGRDAIGVLVGDARQHAALRKRTHRRGPAPRRRSAPRRPLRRHAGGPDARRRRGQRLDRAGSLRPRGDRGAGDGPPGDRRRHGGAAETVEDGATGLLVPPGDAAALGAALDRVLAMPPEARAALGARARAAVRANYTVAAMQAATLLVYQEVLGTAAKR